MARIYAMLALLGAAIPMAPFVPWVAAHGIDARLFVQALFANRISAFFGLDVIVSAVVLILFVLVEGKRAKVRHRWLPIVATCLIGVSCGLPLFLALRERARGK
ncbi:DUF2834 domain-containing protein [Sphingomonas bacterium]|uniref:DUF2834 domain-containing protein n=1 Tax=Sphingomonas bacterium TaxID=1895847 RepID=UPI00157600C4|nr:DUF2834 domain-containing protein [Sphingomonas bacterium]